MNKNTQEIIKNILLLNPVDMERISIEYDVNKKELDYIIKWFGVEENCSQLNTCDDYLEYQQISTIIFHNVIVEIQNDIERILNEIEIE